MDNIIGHTNLIRVLNYLKKKYYNIPKDSNGDYTIGDAITSLYGSEFTLSKPA